MAVTVTLRLTTMDEAESLIDALYAGANLLENEATRERDITHADALRRLAEDIINVTL